MSTIEKIKSGLIFWAGEDMVTAYQFKEHPPMSGQGYITSDHGQHCDVRAFHPEHMEIFYKFFGSWVEANLKYSEIAFSPAEIIERIQAEVPKPKHRPKTGPTDKLETRPLVKYMNALCDEVPRGLSSLKDALTFALLDLSMYNRFSIKSATFDKALAFARSIPHFDDIKSEECAGWMLHDEEHLKYM
jgi:hypothetical protein